jgi:uncharacterized RDD family membrane protein YckC
LVATEAGDGTVEGTRSALIVASDDYTDPGLRRLRAPASDARALAGVLRDPKIGGFEVRTLLNEPAYEVNEAVEEFFADRRPDDLLLLHFSCHGVKDEGGELYFAAANTKLRRLGATAVAAEFVNRRMSRSRSRRVVLLLDCCYAGAFERGMTARAGTGMAIEEQFGGRGRAVITASSAMEYAFEGDQLADTRELAPSVFTSALVEGLETGEADRDQDGMVALDELYDYIHDKVQAATPNQTPGKWTFGVQGDLYIARRARPVTTPAPLPPELQQAIDHPLAAVRAGAVQELARLLGSRHAGLALAGRLALERLSEDDSRAVSAAAAAALGAQAQPVSPEPVLAEPVLAEPVLAEPVLAEPVLAEAVSPEAVSPEPVSPEPAPRLELSATVVDFGHLLLGSRPPPQRVRVHNTGGGSLNAQIAVAPIWVQAQHAGDELILVANTERIGTLTGEVVIESQGGSASVRVTAQVNPPVVQVSEPATADLEQYLTGTETPSRPAEGSSVWPSPATDATQSRPEADEPDDDQGHAMATWQRRLQARLIDWVPPLIILVISAGFDAGVGLVIALLVDLYNRGYLEGVKGQSWGKRALHLRTVRIADKEPIGLAAGISRELVNLLLTIAYLVGLISWVFAIWDARRQTLGDKIMHTVVLSEPTDPSDSQGAAASQPR